MDYKISEARYIDQHGKSVVLTPDDMTRELYQKEYRGALLCPYPRCKARLSFVWQNDPPIHYFRTWKKDGHVSGCPYDVEYSEVIAHRRAYNPEYAYALSDEHVDAILRRAHHVIAGHQKHVNTESKSSSVTKTFLDTSLDPSGVAALLGDSLDLTKGREPKVFIRNTSDLTDSDDGQVRCVIGIASFMWIEELYGYLNLVSSPTQIKIHFNEAFVSTNKTEYRNFHYIKRYILENKSKFICCIGKVSKTRTGFDIRPDRWNGFSVDMKKLYEIVNEYI